PQVLEDAGGDLHPALAVLADAGLHARARQQHADFEGRPLRAADMERSGAGEEARCADPGGKAAPRQADCGTCGLVPRLGIHGRPPFNRTSGAPALIRFRTPAGRAKSPLRPLTLVGALANIVASSN